MPASISSIRSSWIIAGNSAPHVYSVAVREFIFSVVRVGFETTRRQAVYVAIENWYVVTLITLASFSKKPIGFPCETIKSVSWKTCCQIQLDSTFTCM
jgi:hypothetical protein